jgi:hypothetical protein
MVLLQSGHALHIAPADSKVGEAMVLLQSGHALHIAPADFTSVERWFCSRADTLSISPPPTSRRWSGGFLFKQVGVGDFHRFGGLPFLCSLNDLNFLGRQAVEFIHQRVNLAVRARAFVL